MTCSCFVRKSHSGSKIAPATPRDIASTLACALRYKGCKRMRGSGEITAQIVAERLVEADVASPAP